MLLTLSQWLSSEVRAFNVFNYITLRAVLDAVPNPHPDTDYAVRFTAPEFTCLCPITGQPDFAHFVIDYVPGAKIVESKALKLFLHSFRNASGFHEDTTLKIGKRVKQAIKPGTLFRQKARVLKVPFPVFKVDGFVGNIEIATQDNLATLPDQLPEVRLEPRKTAIFGFLALRSGGSGRQVNRHY